MKKLSVLIAALLAALFIAGCATTGPSASDMLAEAKNKAPDDSLVGQGTGTAGKDTDAAAKKAEENAKFQFRRAMSWIVKEMVDDAVTAGRLTSGVAEDFRQSINTAITRVQLTGATKADAGIAAGNVAWAVYYMEKGDALKAVTACVNAAKQDHPAGAFTLDGFDAKFKAAAAREWK
jgi:PBP1b-binding outer membrane lipoprotein LpoB